MTRSTRESPHNRALDQRILRRCLEDFSSPPTGLVVGFSGGNDSLALALLLARRRWQRLLPVRLVHVDHGLRPESAAQADEALALAARVELPCATVRIDAADLARHRGVGMEEAARRERYRQLAAALQPGEALALAHHADDQAETVLMHLLRGAGGRGAAGMPFLATLPVPWWDAADVAPTAVPVWRPLLGERRADLAAVVQRAGLAPIVDPSNADPGYTRNAVRHDLLPAIARVYPGAVDALGRFAHVQQAEDRLLASLAADARQRLATPRGGLDADALLALDVALQRRVVLAWLRDSGAPEPTAERVDAVLAALAAANPAATLEVGGGRVVARVGADARCATLPALRRQLRAEAGLALPLADEVATIAVGAAMADVERTCAVRLPDAAVGALHVRRVARGERLPDGRDVGDWLRARRVSPLIRDGVLGVADDRGLRTIPLIGDNDRNDMAGPTIVVEWTWAGEGKRG
jgi:tRNA(Ile)-lysidine synthetase-like protein